MNNSLPRLKCAFCHWTTSRWLTLKDGRKRSGESRLREHVIDHHTDQYEAALRAEGLLAKHDAELRKAGLLELEEQP